MKTLIVKYLPSGANSNTKKLLDIFLDELKSTNANVEMIDLLKEPAPIFDETSIQAYYKRNYGGKQLEANEAKLLEKNDKLIAQLKSSDILVIACPMHNFGFPAAVKAYLDAVIFNGETFKMGEKLMAGKKSLTIFTSNGMYDEDQVNIEYPHWNTLTLSAKINFRFMGFDDAKVISTSLHDEGTREERLIEVQQKISGLVGRWYKNL